MIGASEVVEVRHRELSKGMSRRNCCESCDDLEMT
jgi:hypothetical protein